MWLTVRPLVPVSVTHICIIHFLHMVLFRYATDWVYSRLKVCKTVFLRRPTCVTACFQLNAVHYMEDTCVQ